MLQLHAEKDELLMQLELLQHKQQQQQGSAGATASGSGSRGAAAMEQQLFELRLQKEQAEAAAVRLRKQLGELFQAATPGAVAADGAEGIGDRTTAEAEPGRPGSAAGECTISRQAYMLLLSGCIDTVCCPQQHQCTQQVRP